MASCEMQSFAVSRIDIRVIDLLNFKAQDVHLIARSIISYNPTLDRNAATQS